MTKRVLAVVLTVITLIFLFFLGLSVHYQNNSFSKETTTALIADIKDITTEEPATTTEEITEETTTKQDTATESTTTESAAKETTTVAPTTTVPATTTQPATTTMVPTTPARQPAAVVPETTTTIPDPAVTEAMTAYSNVSKGKTVTPEALQSHGRDLKVYGVTDENNATIQKLAGILNSYNKNISIAVWRKDGSRAITYNTAQSYFSACTIKTGFIYYCCKQIESGNTSADAVMTYQEKHYHTGSGKIKNSPYGTQYTLGYLIEQAINISDNIAYEMLVDYFGLTGYHQMINEMGCPSLSMAPTIWAYNVLATDYVKIWNACYDYFQTGTPTANLFYTACTNSPFNYGTVTIGHLADYSHKSGDNFGANAVYNDAGIVWAGDTPYIYAVFTNSEGTANDISTVNSAMELVYSIMTSKHLR